MGKQPVQRYKDVDLYAAEIEEVYDLRLEFSFEPNIRASSGMQPFSIKAWDKDDDNPEDGPLLYITSECSPLHTYKRSQAIIRALTLLTHQCLELYITRRTDAVLPA